MSELIFRGGTILTIDDDGRVLTGDVAAIAGTIVHVGGAYTPQTSDYDIIDCTDAVVMPGLVQAHVHLCQTLARGHADDLELLDWLTQIIWPYEAALDAKAMTAAAELGCAELLLGGTTAILDMGSVHHYDQVFAAADRSGLRITGGKAMMDADDPLIPAGLRETTAASMAESAALIDRFHGSANGRLRYAYAPRFALSCTEALLREVGKQAVARGVRIHTHASENRAELAEVQRRHGVDNLAYLAACGICGPHCTIAHCVHVDADGRARLASDGTHVCHCPSSNLKLASGIAAVPELMAAGVSVAIGADGAPCNNNLDGFLELRLTALLHKPASGPRAMPAAVVVAMATRGGARALGLDGADGIGTLQVGKRADLIAVDTLGLHATPVDDPYSFIAYAARSTDVRHVAVDGKLAVRDRALLTLAVDDVRRAARTAARRVFAKVTAGT